MYIELGRLVHTGVRVDLETRGPINAAEMHIGQRHLQSHRRLCASPTEEQEASQTTEEQDPDHRRRRRRLMEELAPPSV